MKKEERIKKKEKRIIKVSPPAMISEIVRKADTLIILYSLFSADPRCSFFDSFEYVLVNKMLVLLPEDIVAQTFI